MKTFNVNFFTIQNGVTSRQRLQGNSTLHLNNASSDFAVQAYLKSRYPGSEIVINNIDWK